MVTIYLARHGQTEWNVERRIQGQMDTMLTSEGERQAVALGKRLRDVEFTAVYASSLTRAWRTAELIAEGRGLAVQKRDALMEIRMGDWQGLLMTDVERMYPTEADLFWNHPALFERDGCELYEEVRARAAAELERIAIDHQGETVLVVAHGALLRILHTYFSHRPIDEVAYEPGLKSTALCVVEKRDGVWNVLKWNDAAHLDNIF